MKVLVMGGTQFNGFALVRELVRTGHEVTILNRGKTVAPVPRSVQRLVCDRTDSDALRAVLGREEFDCVFDISGYRPEDVQLMVEIFRGRVGHYIFASSTVIYAASNLLPIAESHPVDRSERQNEYGLNKLLCEDVLIREHREKGFPASLAAFSMVFGPRNIIPDREQRMFMRLRQGRRVLIPGDGTTVGQVGHVHDEARALCAMMLNPRTFGRRYNLTGADCYTDEGYVDTFADVLDVSPEKVFIPVELMEELWAGKIELSGGPRLRQGGHPQPDRRAGSPPVPAPTVDPASCTAHPPLESQRILQHRAAEAGYRLAAGVQLPERSRADLGVDAGRGVGQDSRVRFRLRGRAAREDRSGLIPRRELTY